MNSSFTDKFVIAKRNTKRPSGVLVKKGDVGIIKPESKEGIPIFFIRIWQEVALNKNDFKIFDVKKTGDGFLKKICNICHKLLNTTEFARNQNGVNNRQVRRPSCQECRKQLEGVSPTPKEKLKWSKTKPQNEPFECPICAKRTIAGITSKVVLDHNHRTGEIRGWVCDSCNTGIGRFKDDVGLIKRAIKFLE
ncbi:Hpy99I family type II restriction endonuclease [Candidatus Collierbacteria bacterium]|nr:Hpy99I family type II restriction endonuclease [Candidatus Collierbacteria bacterium]